MIVHHTIQMIQDGMMHFEREAVVATDLKRQTIDLWPDFAVIIGLGRNSAYAGARRGDFRTIRIGKKIVVPKAEVERLLTGAPQEKAKP